ncbi:MAG TPA: DMT family transporter [Solirubrobacteraceae bacterium]|nr:DMT family transporter [Solirubrobacteraceae bacterium]
MTPRAWLLLGICSALWGLPYLLIKVLVEDGVPAGVITFGRCAIGAAVLLPIAWRAGALAPLRGRWRAIAVLALLDMAAPFLMITVGERHIPSSLAGILVASVPLLVALLALRWDAEERVDRSRLVGLLIGMAGVALLLGVEVSGDVAALAGAGLVLAASATYAGATLYLKRALGGLPALGIVTLTLTAATLMLAPLALLQAGGVPAARLDWLSSLAALGVLCSALAYLAFYALVALVGPGRASLNTYLSPAIAAAAGAVFLGESLGAGAVAGLLLILAGAYLSSGGRPPAPRPEPTAALSEGARA